MANKMGSNTTNKPKSHVAKWTPPPYDPDLPTCIIVDVDGTLAHIDDRSPYDYTKVHTDIVDNVVRDIVHKYYHPQIPFSGIDLTDTYIIIVTGRHNTCHDETVDWLRQNDIQFHELYMRDPSRVDAKGNKLDDTIIKKDIYEEFIKPRFNVRFVLEDRDRVVRMWREQGLKVLQVQEGAF